VLGMRILRGLWERQEKLFRLPEWRQPQGVQLNLTTARFAATLRSAYPSGLCRETRYLSAGFLLRAGHEVHQASSHNR
jgi:hypothetical protein